MANKGNIKSIMSEVNRILSINDSYEAPERVLKVVTSDNKRERDQIYYELAKLNKFDFSKDWFWEYFQEEHADRHQNKQDFTPGGISSIIHHILKDNQTDGEGTGIMYDPAAGTGQLLIRDWFHTRLKEKAWDYKPSHHMVVCCEISQKTVPFLLFNLAVRGISGVVYHMDTMKKNLTAIYVLANPTDSALSYSDVVRLDKGCEEETMLFNLFNEAV